MKQRTLEGILVTGEGPAFRGKLTFSEVIESIEVISESTSPAREYIVPGLIDLQVNGFSRFDVMTADPSQIVALARVLSEQGTTSLLPTAITAPVEHLIRVHRAVEVAAQQANSTGDGAGILGLHLEGPFISPLRLGVHPPYNLVPSRAAIEPILKMSHLKLITLAPELDGALEAIHAFTRRSVVVSLGHSNATLEEATAAVKAGARMFTHLFNAMREVHHREPGIAGAALLPSPAYVGLIADGVHVHPAMLRLTLKLCGAERIILTSDSVALCKSNQLSDKDRQFSASRSASVDNTVARTPSGQLAGSLSSLLDGLRTMINSAGANLEEGVLMAATNPARLLNLSDRGVLKLGARADLLILDPALALKAVFVGGRELN